jgi:hypothetical protein
MPEEGVDLSPSSQLLTTEEILRLVGASPCHFPSTVLILLLGLTTRLMGD